MIPDRQGLVEESSWNFLAVSTTVTFVSISPCIVDGRKQFHNTKRGHEMILASMILGSGESHFFETSNTEFCSVSICHVIISARLVLRSAVNPEAS